MPVLVVAVALIVVLGLVVAAWRSRRHKWVKAEVVFADRLFGYTPAQGPRPTWARGARMVLHCRVAQIAGATPGAQADVFVRGREIFGGVREHDQVLVPSHVFGGRPEVKMFLNMTTSTKVTVTGGWFPFLIVAYLGAASAAAVLFVDAIFLN